MFIDILFIAHASVTLVAILSEVLHYKRYITKRFEQVQKCKFRSIKMYDLKYILNTKFTYLLIHSMEQSPFGEANRFSANQ